MKAMPRSTPPGATAAPAPADTRRYVIECVDEAAVVQLYADGFTGLPLREKTLVWHLYLAAIAGRDIYYDQRYAHNLAMRDIVEAVLTHGAGVDEATLREVRRYAKLFWINTGPYNNLTARKFVLHLVPGELAAAARAAAPAGAVLPQRDGESVEAMVARMAPLFFDADHDPILTNKTPGDGLDILQASANNLTDELIYESCGASRGVYRYRHERPRWWGVEFSTRFGG